MGVGAHKVRTCCGLCRHDKLTEVINLGNTPLANEFLTAEDIEHLSNFKTEQEVFPLALVRCDACRHVQTSVIVSADRLFSHYLYATGTSRVTVEHFTAYAHEVTERFGLLKKKDAGFVVEIGSNDGTMLKAFKDLGVGKVLGIDPAANVVKDAEVETIVGFFGKHVGENIAHVRGHANLVVANNVLAHAEDVLDILEGVRALLGTSGIFVFEVSYLMDMFEHMAFDTIYHEHFAYHTLGPLSIRLDKLGMRIIDVQRTPGQMGRGSIRIFTAPYTAETSSKDWYESKLVGPNFTNRLKALSMEENAIHQSLLPWHLLKRNILAEGTVLRNRMLRWRNENMIVCGYGAPAKLTTLTYAMNLPLKLVNYIIDDAPLKIGRFTPGQHVPIVSPIGVENPPHVCILFAWNFADAIVEKWRSGGVVGKDGVPLPVPLFVHPLSSLWS
jgi:SAM-dependent methyltransferase